MFNFQCLILKLNSNKPHSSAPSTQNKPDYFSSFHCPSHINSICVIYLYIYSFFLAGSFLAKTVMRKGIFWFTSFAMNKNKVQIYSADSTPSKHFSEDSHVKVLTEYVAYFYYLQIIR